MSELISYQFEDGITTLTLNNGKVNAISPAVIDAFNQALDQALQDKAVVIVTGQPGILSGGYDLKVMTSGPENAVNLVAAGSTLARRLLSHPYPVIVACPGHAVAKGAFLLLSADYRIGVDGPFQIGLTLATLDVTLHVGAGRDHAVAHAVGVLQGVFGQRGGDTATPQRIRYEGPVDVQRLLAQVHIRQIGTMAIHRRLELMAAHVMMDGQGLAHFGSPQRVRNPTRA